MGKAVRVLNRFSSILFIAILLLVYAYLPVQVDLKVQELSVHKQHFFYYSLGTFILVNILLRLVLGYGLRSLNLSIRSWMMGLIFLLNFYITLIIGFIGVLNNSTHVSPSSYAYLNFLGPILLIGWMIGLIFLVFKKS
ncbi:MAG: hypothetical protein AAGA66_08305 [Bacteroidota bacterium]